MRTFIAIETSEELREKMAELQKQLAIEGVKPVEKENLHLTLHFLGEIDEVMKDKVIKGMDKLNCKKFEMSCEVVGAFPSKNYIRVIWVGAEAPELKQIYDQLGTEFARLGFKQEQFSPHITLARVKFLKDKEKLTEFLEENEQVELGDCKVDGVFLKKSTLTPKGPIYENVYEKKLL
ncbi:RNA 2',3'-cyclic phosphodiesterase [Candidatus Micrarchaeota archaeon]|nr:RNA 2',3'-cyclic phosphodiesterase [Candidatus Micrarchaeota archaeon]